MRPITRTFSIWLTAALLAQPFAGYSQQGGVTQLTAQQLLEAKKAGAEAANAGQRTGVAIGADGEIERDASGAPKTKAYSIDDQFKHVKGLTGLGEVTQTATPGRDGTAAGAQATVNAQQDISCNLRAGSHFSVGGVEFLLGGCSMAPDGRVQSMSVKVCADSLRSQTCDAGEKSTDFSALELSAGAYQTKDGVQYGLACNSTGLCRVHVTGSYSVQGTGEQIAKAAKDLRANDKSESYVASLSKLYTDEKLEYNRKVTEDGAAMQACHQRSLQSVSAGGPPIDCDGKAVDSDIVNPSTPGGSAPSGAQCGREAQCIREAVTQSSFTRTCVRTFPLTVKSTTFQYNTRLECVELDGKNSCDKPAPLASATPSAPSSSEEWKDPRAGLTEIGVKKTCVESAETGCKREQTAYSYVDLRAEGITTLQVGASPSPVSKSNPVCDDSLTPSQKTCASGDWFGRTLSDGECTVLYDEDGETLTEQLNWQDKPGCGVCMTPTYHATCYGEPSEEDEADTCATSELQGCTLQGSPKAGSFSEGDGTGLVISQEETYTCTSESRVCVEREPMAAECLTQGIAGQPQTFGLEAGTGEVSADAGAFGNAMAQAAVLDGVAKSLHDAQDPTFPLIFDGENLRCNRPTGGLGGLLSKNCCRTDLQRPKKGNIIQKGCGDNEVKLAAARRASTTVYIGEYCSKKMRFPKKCLRITQSYCAFPGTLPRIVQVQGRQQLANIGSSSAGATQKQADFKFSYYNNAAVGAWTPVLEVNSVRMAAWRYPAYCKSPELAAQQFAQDPEAQDCPATLDLWVVTCDVATGCGELPQSPDEGAAGWGLNVVDPLKNFTTAVSRYAVLSGACDPATEQCEYKAKAWPAGQGGKVTVARDFSFPLYSSAGSGTPMLGNVADLMFRAYSVPGAMQATLPASVRIDFSTNGGQSWTTVQVPSHLGDSDMSVAASDIKLSGGCRADANVCTYRLVGTTTVTQKPWGSAKNPDCSGFTPGQLGALDFGRMDLSEWVNEVVSKASAQADKVGTKAAADAVKAQMSVQGNTLDSYQSGSATLKTQTPNIRPFAIVTPGEGYGPFNVNLKASGRYPFDPAAPDSGEQVTRIDVDWGDCSPVEPMSFVNTFEGQKANGYVLGHRYLAPNADKHLSCGVGKDDSVVHKLKLKVYTVKGTHDISVQVKNSWNSVGGDFTGNMAGSPQERSVTIKKETE